MTHRKPTLATGEDIQAHFEDAIGLLRSVRRTLRNLLERAEDGDDAVLKEIGLKQSELESALKRAFDAEERYNDWQARTSGLRNAAEIDFAALREELACRINTLRDCCQEG
jgi:hypothetical protein